MIPTGHPLGIRHPPQPSALAASRGPGVRVSRRCTDESRHVPRDEDGTRLNIPSGRFSDHDLAEEMKERSKMDEMRHDANVKSNILIWLTSFGIPCHDAGLQMSERKTLSARYEHRLKGHFSHL